MKQVIIENPVINSAFKEPLCHFRFTEEGITDEIVESRRTSAYFVPIAPPKKKGKQGQLALGTEWTQDRLKENKFSNRVRERVVVKTSTACTLWIPAINNHGGFGRWAFLEIIDPWNAKNSINVS